MEKTTKPPELPLIFTEVKKHIGNKTSVWHYFLKEEKGQYAKCKVDGCFQILKTGGGSTSSLHNHIRSKHDDALRKAERETESSNAGTKGPPPKKAKKIPEFFSTNLEKSLHTTIARMASLDGLPFEVFCTSKDLRMALSSVGFEETLPKSPSSIKNIVMNYCHNIRKKQLAEIEKIKSSGMKFSIIFDEWTSSRNRRFMNLILSATKAQFWNFGLLRIVGSLTAENSITLVSDKLEKNNLSLQEDIVSVITDGTSVMTKIGKLLSPIHQQLCLAHGIQLAVTDVLYPNSKKKSEEVLERSVEVNDDDDEDTDQEVDEIENDKEPVFFELPHEETDISNEAIKPIIQKVRKLVKLFRRSPLKNEALQKHVIIDFKKELPLILDSKTRWNSLLDMLERFYLLKNCILKTLIDLKTPISLEEWEIARVNDVIEALSPLKVTVEALCRRDSDLLSADAALNYALKKIEGCSSAVAQELSLSFRKRIKERRTELSGVMQYLHSGSTLPKENYDEIFEVPNKSKISVTLKSLLSRLHPTPPDLSHSQMNEPSLISTETVVAMECSENNEIQGRKKKEKTPLQNEINKAIEEIYSTAHTERCQPTQSLLSTIKKEMGLFEAGGSRGHHLQIAYDHILSIKPTSVESERAFSSAGYICNKIRSSLNDDTLDAICFLRSHFKSIDE